MSGASAQDAVSTKNTPRGPVGRNLAAAVETLKTAKEELTAALEKAHQDGTTVDSKTTDALIEFMRLQEKIEDEAKKHTSMEHKIIIAGVITVAALLLVDATLWIKERSNAKNFDEFKDATILVLENLEKAPDKKTTATGAEHSVADLRKHFGAPVTRTTYTTGPAPK